MFDLLILKCLAQILLNVDVLHRILLTGQNCFNCKQLQVPA